MRILLLGLMLVLLSAGCTPERISWSKDGKHALVTTKVGTYLTDARGESVKVNGDRPTSLTPVVWIPDSNRFLQARTESFATWSEIATELGPKKAKRIEKLVERIKKRAARDDSPVEEFNSNLGVPRWQVSAAWICWRDTEITSLVEFLSRDPKQRNNLRPGGDWKLQKFAIDLYETTGLEARKIRTLRDSFVSFATLRPSPDGKSLAVVEETDAYRFPDLSGMIISNLSRTRLVVQSLVDDAHEPIEIALDVAVWPAWSQDGRSLFHMGLESPHQRMDVNRSIIGRLHRSDFVLSESGVDRVDAKSQLGAVKFNVFAKLFAITDERLLFTSPKLALPTTDIDDSKELGVFQLVPGDPTRLVETAHDPWEYDVVDALSLSAFSPSPDGQRLALTTKEGQTGIMDLANGQIEWIQPTKIKGDVKSWRWNPPMAPAWRNNDEVSFAAPPNAPMTGSDRSEFVLWTPTGITILSQNWSTGLLADE